MKKSILALAITASLVFAGYAKADNDITWTLNGTVTVFF